jgi:3',5'-cyclic AMP phosphodiesterase CpdA
MRIVLVTDTHLAPGAAACDQNWRAVRRFVERAGADLTVHLGDITVDGASDAGQLEDARRACADWPSPIRFLPGNHDIGDNPPAPEVPAKEPLNLDRLADYRATFGPDWWSLPTEGGPLIGLHAQLFGTGTEAERAQWSWLERELDALDEPMVLLLHKPMFQAAPDDAKPQIRYLPLAPRRRLFALLRGKRVRIVLSGHTHQHLDRTIDGLRHVWLP